MKIKIFCYLVGTLVCLLISHSIVYADDSYQIYGIFHKQKYTIRMYLSLEEEYAKEKIILSLLEQEKLLDSLTMIIPHLSGVRKSEILSDTFLSFTFSQQAGTSIQIRGTKFIGVKDAKLFVALDLLTTNNFYSIDLGQEKYEVSLDLSGNSYKNFTLQVKESHYLYDPPKHEKWEKVFNIPFNYEEMIFTNGETILNGEFVFENSTKEKRFLKNKKVKKVTLKDQEYLYINNKWYSRTGTNLTEM